MAGSEPQGRLTAAAAVATLLASITLVPLVQGGGWFVAVCGLVAVVAGVGAAGRYLVRAWPAVVALQLLVLVAVVTWMFARDVAVLGVVPGPDAVTALSDLARAGLEVTRTQAPPVSAPLGVVLVVCGGIGLVALVVDLVAASLRRPAVAGLPLLAVYCVPAAVLPGGLSWWYFVLAASGFLVLVGADSTDRIRGWGRVLGPAGDERGDRALGGPLAGARRLAVGCVVVSAMVPVLVPGLGEQLLGGSGRGQGPGRGGSITVINPILRLKDNLTARTNVVVIRYTTDAARPQPLRIVSDDVFDGTQWSPSTGEIPRDNTVDKGLPAVPGLSPAVPRREQRTRITTLDLGQTYLPLPYPARRVDVKGPWLYDATSLNVVGDGVTAQNLDYVVDHYDVEPTAGQLENAPAPPADVVKAFTRLPSTLPKLVPDTARRVGGTGSPYQQALAIQQWLRSGGGFVYSTQVDAPAGAQPSGQDAVAAFLTARRGYCVQFASAMAVMARTLGIPSRVAVGFLPGRQVRPGAYEIAQRDAHAWPELYFGGVGWVRFEPTPTARAGAAPGYAQPEAPAAPTPTATETAAPSATASAAAPTRPERPEQDETAAPQVPLLQRVLDAVPWRWLAALAGLALLGGVPLGVELLVRRARWRRAGQGSPVARVEAAWDELRDELEDLGVSWAASWTPRALQLRLVSDHGLPGSAQAALGRLVADLEHARYAPPDGVVREVAALRADVATVVDAVRRSARVAPWARRRARWFPTSGLRVLGRAARRVDVAADEAGRAVSRLGADVRRRVTLPRR